MEKGEFCRIHIRVKAATSLGQVVAVGGSGPTFGNFDPQHTISLVTTPESYPVWYTLHPIVVPRYVSVEYNYCVLEGGSLKAFEYTEHPRVLYPKDIDVIVEDEFNPDKLIGYGVDAEEVYMDVHKEEAANRRRISEFHESQRLFLTCYHLPVSVRRTSPGSTHSFEVSWTDSLIAPTGESISEQVATYWVGTVHVPGEKLSPNEIAELTAQLLQLNCHPIFLDDDLATACYHGYCKQVLWPTFHNIDPLDHMHSVWNTTSSTQPSTFKWDTLNKHAAWWEAYNEVTSIFVTKLKALLTNPSQDILWVHDYHLMLLPGLIRNELPAIKTVFFLHIPFPTSQIFRSLPYAVDLLQSIVQADVIGFHSFDYCRHFLQATRRMIGARSHNIQGGLLALSIGTREVIVSMSHVSINPKLLDKVLTDSTTQSLAENMRAKYPNKRLIVGVDACQRLSGGFFKLEALRTLLAEQVGVFPPPVNCVLVLRVIRNKSRPEDEAATGSELAEMVNVMNEKYGLVVDYQEVTSLSLQERVALWLSADVFLNTSIREGLNLLPLEYIYCRKDLGSAGVVIASEFSAISSLLNGSIKINPHNARQLADALLKAISMTSAECNSRRQRDLHFVCSRSSAEWSRQILSDLQLASSVANDEPLSTPRQKKITGIPLVQKREIFPLQQYGVVNAYETALSRCGLVQRCSRVFVLDYGGTLLKKEKYDIYIKQTLSAISGRVPEASMMHALRRLSEDPANAVLIVTGLTRAKLGGLLDDLHNVTIATSNGMVTSWGASLMTTDAEASEAGEGLSCRSVPSEDMAVEAEDVIRQLSVSPSSSDMDLRESGLSAGDVTPSHRRRNRHTSSAYDAGYRRHSATFDGSLHDPEEDPMTVPSVPRSWDTMNLAVDWTRVKQIAIPIISKFTYKTNGSCFSPRIPGIGWSYFGTDPDWGTKQAAQLKRELEAALVNHDVSVVSQIAGSIEIVPKTFHKGLIVKEFLQRVRNMRAGRLPAFAISMGDDALDDTMFNALYGMVEDSRAQDCVQDMAGFSAIVGKTSNTTALAYVPAVQDVTELLSAMAESSSTRSATSSLRSLQTGI